MTYDKMAHDKSAICREREYDGFNCGIYKKQGDWQ